MPAVQAPATVLVSGASGFIAAWIIKTLLDQGFDVRGTVRSSSKGDQLVKLFKDYGSKFSYVLVEDISLDGAFDEAVKGVDAIIHTASPFVGNAQEPDEWIKPAVDGTLNALKSAKEFGTSVKRVVITSSVAAVQQPKTEMPAIYTETDWNTSAVEEVKEKGAQAGHLVKYRASKVLAERAAWDFVEENKGEIGFDIATILPSFVFGPLLHDVPSPAQLSVSPKMFYEAIRGQGYPQQRASFGINYVDVRDVAELHVRALTNEAAGGERFICSAGSFSWQEAYNILNSAEPPISNVPKGNPAAQSIHQMIHSSDKARFLLGFEFTSVEKMTVDTLRSLREREAGWAVSNV
ncbi:hypothetical protein BOTBODRAFT_29272 [Botryobasidium botryosum FD-172 SS1]|uniref:NAD-dependent epimerase/dehydratase domain-containing protein n=1 Tax=Botryobasidium botryosum (strain FD-172 SS1) TaxID=930990 RepID=A0A067MTC0_BOTB1|nr:hypothetical protein BOTBODRAFT_29272 [Botryobasidium botryosum FD-172 SS1]